MSCLKGGVCTGCAECEPSTTYKYDDVKVELGVRTAELSEAIERIAQLEAENSALMGNLELLRMAENTNIMLKQGAKIHNLIKQVDIMKAALTEISTESMSMYFAQGALLQSKYDKADAALAEVKKIEDVK